MRLWERWRCWAKSEGFRGYAAIAWFVTFLRRKLLDQHLTGSATAVPGRPSVMRVSSIVDNCGFAWRFSEDSLSSSGALEGIIGHRYWVRLLPVFISIQNTKALYGAQRENLLFQIPPAATDLMQAGKGFLTG